MSLLSRARTSAVLLCLVGSGCASTIGNRAALDEVAFEVGKTHKSQISNVLGFPSNRQTDDTHEFWGYRDKPELYGLVYALPTGTNTVTTYTATKIASGSIQMDSAAIIYTFDSSGTLVDVYERDKN